ncbi:MAG TPA: hypothetical protein VNJ51_04510 [Candidatus Dormibacteraeota bacterium]|nr:hypothetical protein [Candidatus Dormibacteraeota bacterium]
MPTLLRRALPALLLLAAIAAVAAPGAARTRPSDDRPNETSTATPPPYHPNLSIAFGPFALGAKRSEIDHLAGTASNPKNDVVRYQLQDGETVSVTYANDAAKAISITRPFGAKTKALLATSDGIRLGAPIGAALPLYGPPAAEEPGKGPGYTLYAWRMHEGRSVVFQTFLGSIVSVDLLPPNPYPPDVKILGGSGTSQEDPLKISAPTHDKAVEAEYTWLQRVNCGAAGFRFVYEKNLTDKNRKLEKLSLYCDADQAVYFFDVTDVPKTK